ncbi:MAG: ASKHA domain-containing protein [Candidatus Omnitrophota bacterium]
MILIVDIGTTTVSGSVLDVETKKAVAQAVVFNKQITFGEDVVSRIDFALKAAKNSEKLHDAVVDSLNELFGLLIKKASLKHKDISSIYCVCNTAMHHLFLGINPAPLVTPPYKAAQKAESLVYSERMGIKLEKDIPITVFPNIGGFVGSDALAVIAASGIHCSEELQLAVDIGTNGEVILGNSEKIMVSSTACGPAFEGKHISCGMLAEKGAIERVWINKQGVKLQVVGDIAPKGICASGLIDAVSEMLKAGIVDETGKMEQERYILYKKGKREIFINQQDIRKLQLAKAAIYAAVRVLLRNYGVGETAIKKVIITGSFGNKLRGESVENIELIPGVKKKHMVSIANGALEGLRMMAASPAVREKITSTLSITRHIPLFGKSFTKEFTAGMGFLHH